MAIRKIARLGHPVLRKEAADVPVNLILSEEIQRLIRDLHETVLDADGAGLAAPQVHESKRIVVLDLEDGSGFQVWINPTLTPIGDEWTITFEGCLSVPQLRGAVARISKVRVEAYNEEAEKIDIILDDFPAIVAQHECDHLDGILFVDRVEPGTLCFLEEYRKYMLGVDFTEEEEE